MNSLLHFACLLAALAAGPVRQHAPPRSGMTEQQQQRLRQQQEQRQQNQQQQQLNQQQQQQQQTPPNWTDTGTFEGTSGSYVMMKNAGGQPWQIEIAPQTTVTVEGTAEPSYLKPKVFVSFSADLDEKQAVKGEIAEMEVYTPQNKKDMGLFLGADPKPVPKPTAGAYNVKGKVISLKGETLTVLAGNKKVSGKLSPAAKIKVKVREIGLAQSGDTVKVSGWGVPNQPQHARAAEMNVTMAKPLAGKKQKMARTRGSKKESSAPAGNFGFGDPPPKN